MDIRTTRQQQRRRLFPTSLEDLRSRGSLDDITITINIIRIDAKTTETAILFSVVLVIFIIIRCDG